MPTPEGLTVTQLNRGIFDFNATLEWVTSLPAQPVDYYTVTITPAGQMPISFLVYSPTLMATLLQYNIKNVISITASNCAGTSTDFESTIQSSKYNCSIL